MSTQFKNENKVKKLIIYGTIDDCFVFEQFVTFKYYRSRREQYATVQHLAKYLLFPGGIYKSIFVQLYLYIFKIYMYLFYLYIFPDGIYNRVLMAIERLRTVPLRTFFW